jgi:hypothetical protein
MQDILTSQWKGSCYVCCRIHCQYWGRAGPEVVEAIWHWFCLYNIKSACHHRAIQKVVNALKRAWKLQLSLIINGTHTGPQRAKFPTNFLWVLQALAMTPRVTRERLIRHSVSSFASISIPNDVTASVILQFRNILAAMWPVHMLFISKELKTPGKNLLNFPWDFVMFCPCTCFHSKNPLY